MKRGRPPKIPIEMLVVFNDAQLYRNCDEEALGAFLKFIEDHKYKITHLVANGDITDYEAQSRFSKTPDAMGRAEEEIIATQWLFTHISKVLPLAEKVMVNGNHDHRWVNMIKDQTMGIEEWMKTPGEMFDYKKLGWKEIGYGQGKFYQWHDWIFWHGNRAGAKSNIPKLELDDSRISGSSAHINRNMMYESRDALGRVHRWFVHGGFSKDNLNYVKKANTSWTQGFGVYFWSKPTGVQPYMVTMNHGNPQFIWNGKIYSGKGFRIPI